MQFLQTFGDQRHVAGADFEEAVAAERAAASALQVLRLRLRDRAKEIVRAIEDARVRFISRFPRHATHNRRGDNLLSLVVYNRGLRGWVRLPRACFPAPNSLCKSI